MSYGLRFALSARNASIFNVSQKPPQNYYSAFQINHRTHVIQALMEVPNMQVFNQ